METTRLPVGLLNFVKRLFKFCVTYWLAMTVT